MTRSLNFTFKTADDKNKSLRISDYEGEVPAGSAEALMTAICTSKLFVKDGVQQFSRPMSVHAVDTESTVVYEADSAEEA